jgi:hypothetical protein
VRCSKPQITGGSGSEIVDISFYAPCFAFRGEFSWRIKVLLACCFLFSCRVEIQTDDESYAFVFLFAVSKLITRVMPLRMAFAVRSLKLHVLSEFSAVRRNPPNGLLKG